MIFKEEPKLQPLHALLPLGFCFQMLWQGLIVRSGNIGYAPTDIHLLFYSFFGIFSLLATLIFFAKGRFDFSSYLVALGAAGMVFELLGSLAPMASSFISSEDVAFAGGILGALGSVLSYLAWGAFFARIPFKRSLLTILAVSGLSFMLFPWVYLVFPIAAAVVLSFLPVGSTLCLLASIKVLPVNDAPEPTAPDAETPVKAALDESAREKQRKRRFFLARFLAAFALYGFVLTLRKPMGIVSSSGDLLISLLFNGIALLAVAWLCWRTVVLHKRFPFARTVQLLLAVFAVGFFLQPYAPDGVAEALPTAFHVLTAFIFSITWLVTVGVARSSRRNPLVAIGVWGACYGCPRLLNYLLGFAIPASVGGLENKMAISLVALFVLFLAILFISLNMDNASGFQLETHEETSLREEDKADVKLQHIAQEYSLTKRECEVLGYVLNGHSRRYIADQLFISENTVKAHLKKIYLKMNVHSKYEMERLLSMRG